MVSVLLMMKVILGDVIEHGTQIQTILALVALVSSGLISYGLAVTLTGVFSIKNFRKLISKKKA